MYPWLILVPRVANLREIHHLAPEQQQQLMQESCAVATLMERHWTRTRSTWRPSAIWCLSCTCTTWPVQLGCGLARSHLGCLSRHSL